MRLPLAAVLAGGCALSPVRPEGFVCPARGGPAWVEVRTAHFQLRTDLSEARARAFAAELEVIHASHRAFFGGGAPAAVVPVTVFRTKRAYRAAGLPNRQATTLVDEGGVRVVIAATPEVAGGTARQRAAVIERFEREGTVLSAAGRHELGHVFAQRVLGNGAPGWLQEGIASYLEGARLEGGRAVFGRFPPGRVRELDVDPLPARALLAPSITQPAHAYSTSALRLVGALAGGHPERFQAYLGRLSEGAAPEAAWAEAFPAFDVDRPEDMRRLDAEVAAWRGDRDELSRPAPEPGPVRWARPIGSGDVHAERLAVRVGPDAPSLQPFADEVAEALREDPANERALLLDARLASRAERLERLRAAHARAPWSVAVALELAEALPAGDPRRRDALELALGGEPADGEQRARLARALVEEGRSADALPVALRATEEVPWSWRGWYALAAAQAGAGRCGEAAGALPALEARLPRQRPRGWTVAELNARIAACREVASIRR